MDTVDRFTTKAEHYVRYRWDYAPEAFVALRDHAHLSAFTRVADIGSGPGTIARHLINQVARIDAIEPNGAMRQMAQRTLGTLPNLEFLDALASETTLPDRSVDLITVGRALHWFPRVSTRQEFQRILVPGGWLAIFKVSCSNPDLLKAMESLKTKTLGWDSSTPAGKIDPPLLSFYFGHEHYQILEFPHRQQERLSDFLGRLTSKSHAPDPGYPAYPRFQEAVKAIFAQFAHDDLLTLDLSTELVLGQIC
ncbi:MAG: class I SAM-dependent methyltransferase [Synechococcaceae cyanobacterium SM2_3_1]|nr:class I SAM-dependent methyltransferase [Synechococcaceae cyanobacterium SM2_3_1]